MVMTKEEQRNQTILYLNKANAIDMVEIQELVKTRREQISKQKMSENTKKLYGVDNPNYKREYKESEKIFDTWEIINKNGVIIKVDNLTKFCKENKLV